MFRNWTFGAFSAGFCAIATASVIGAGSPPRAAWVVPGAGTGAGRTFTFVYSDADGASDVVLTEGLVVSGMELTGAQACYFFASGNQFWLRDDANSEWTGPVPAGSARAVRNSQCTLWGPGSSVSASGDNVTMTVTVTFTPSFAGAKTVYMKATDRGGLSSDWAGAGTWQAAPLNPGFDLVVSSCADPSRDPALTIKSVTDQDGNLVTQTVIPSCFPSYASYVKQEGYFLEGDRRPLPIMGRTCGHFDVLFVLVDSDINRRKLLNNASVPSTVKAKITDDRLSEAWNELVASYTTAAVLSGIRSPLAASAVDFSVSAALTRLPWRALDLADDGLGFARYDAVVVVDDLSFFGGISAHGVERWPSRYTRPLFYGRDGSFFLHIDPFWLTPALFGHELLHRNMPGTLKEYQFGPRTLVKEPDGVTYDRTPIINPRTGENIEPLLRSNAGRTPLVEYLAGFGDVDGDAVADCVDPDIATTSDNIDRDFVPDRFDPDLGFDHRPYSWMYAARP